MGNATPWIAAATLFALSACATPVEDLEKTPVSIVSGEVAFEAVVMEEVDELQGVTDFGSTAGVLHAAAAAGVYRQELGAWVPVEVFAMDGQPLTSEGVLALVERPAGGLLAVGGGAVFYTELGQLVPSNLLLGFPDITVHAIATQSDGEEEVVWIAASGGLRRVDPDGASLVSLPGVSGDPIDVAADGATVVVIVEEQAIVLDTASWALTRPDLPEVLASAAVGGGGALCVATSGGLLERGLDGQWRLHEIGDIHGLPMAASGDGGCLVGMSDGVIRTSGGALVGHSLGEAPEALGVDEHGQIWTAREGRVSVLRTGDPPSFTGDVAEVFAMCGGCHADGTFAPERDFTDLGEVTALASDIHARVNTGQMPPGGLGSEDLATLNAWFNAGMNP